MFFSDSLTTPPRGIVTTDVAHNTASHYSLPYTQAVFSSETEFSPSSCGIPVTDLIRNTATSQPTPLPQEKQLHSLTTPQRSILPANIAHSTALPYSLPYTQAIFSSEKFSQAPCGMPNNDLIRNTVSSQPTPLPQEKTLHPLANRPRGNVPANVAHNTAPLYSAPYFQGNESQPAHENTESLTPRKRKYTPRSKLPKAQRKSEIAEKKRKKLVEKHPLLPPCSCARKCSSLISEERRKIIHEKFWKSDKRDRDNFLGYNAMLVAKTRNSGDDSRRANTTMYRLKNDKGKNIQVCKKFFLSTLGMTSDSIMRRVQSEDPSVPKVKKSGKYEHKRKVNREALKAHVDKYNPAQSRRKHAPNRFYLPSDLTISEMHQDFLKTHPECSYETYRLYVSKERNISFTKISGKKNAKTARPHNST